MRLALVDRFRRVQRKLKKTNVIFYFDRVLVEHRGVIATVPESELCAFEPFLKEQGLRVRSLKSGRGPLVPLGRKVHRLEPTAVVRKGA